MGPDVVVFLIPIAAILVGGVIAVVSILGAYVTSQTRTKEREQSRREIAAYVAEGSMSPDEGERLLRAEPKGDWRRS